jgi:hypothetical protein
MKTIRTRRRGKRTSLEAKLVAYSALAGAALAVAPQPAQAVECQGGVVIDTVCYTDVVPDRYLWDHGQPTFQSTCFVNWDGMDAPSLSIRFFHGEIIGGATSWQGVRVLGGVALLGGLGSLTRGPDSLRPAALVPGDVVGASGLGQWGTNRILAFSNHTSDTWQTAGGNFLGRSDRFLGARFQLDGATHYGWVRLTVAWNASSATVKDYAFNMVPCAPLPTTLGAPTNFIFGDDFEGGNTARWSATVP